MAGWVIRMSPTPPSLHPLLWRERPASASNSKEHVFSLLLEQDYYCKTAFRISKVIYGEGIMWSLNSFWAPRPWLCLWVNAATGRTPWCDVCTRRRGASGLCCSPRCILRTWRAESRTRPGVLTMFNTEPNFSKEKDRSIYVCIHIQTKAGV